MPICCNLLSDGLKQYLLQCQFCNAKGKSCDEPQIISPSTQKKYFGIGNFCFINNLNS